MLALFAACALIFASPEATISSTTLVAADEAPADESVEAQTEAPPAARSKPLTQQEKQQRYMARINKKYLTDREAESDVTKTASGLMYKVLTAAPAGGPHPRPDSQVKVHYKGTLVNQKQFDSSYDRGEPATFGVNQVIAGWTEALQLMSPGDTWELYIPSHLGYGARGTGRDIGPNATLVFKVELIEIIGSSSAEL